MRQIAFITENGEKCHDIRGIIGIHPYDSDNIYANYATDTKRYAPAGIRARRRREKKAGGEKERERIGR